MPVLNDLHEWLDGFRWFWPLSEAWGCPCGCSGCADCQALIDAAASGMFFALSTLRIHVHLSRPSGLQHHLRRRSLDPAPVVRDVPITLGLLEVREHRLEFGRDRAAEARDVLHRYDDDAGT